MNQQMGVAEQGLPMDTTMQGTLMPVPWQSDMPQQMASSGQKQQLLDMVEQIRGKLQHFNAIKYAVKDKTDMRRQEVLKRVFEILGLSGVDLSNQESVSAYMEKLRTQNPELAQWFENSMNILLGEDNMGMPGEQGVFSPQGDQSQLLQDLGPGSFPNLNQPQNQYEQSNGQQPDTSQILPQG